MNKLLFLFFIALLWSCTQNSETEKHQNKRDIIINVRDRVKEILTENIPIGSFAEPYLMDDYLIIMDHRSYDEMIVLFNRNNFHYLASTATRGQGPGEIANIGQMGINETERIFYVNDHGKQQIFSFQLDSVLANPFYKPEVKLRMNETRFPSGYQYINDTLCIAKIIEPIGVNDFNAFMGRWNMETGEIQLMKYKHPDVKKRRFDFAVSVENGLYVECHNRHDLMTICDIEGNLKYNIYGKQWSKDVKRIHHYGRVEFCGDRIFATYSGEEPFTKGETTELRSLQPTKFLVFDLDGNYLKTLETGYRIWYFCYDKKKNGIIMSLDDDIQFAYLDLNGIID